jgi:hypothetical protein
MICKLQKNRTGLKVIKMDEQLGQIKSRWFGLKKSNVRRMIRRLEQLQQAELGPLQERVNELKKEQSRLNQEREQLMKRRIEMMTGDEFKELAFERLTEAVDILDKYAEEESRGITGLRDNLKRIYRERMEQIDYKAQRYRDLTQGLLSELSLLIEQIHKESWPDIEEASINKDSNVTETNRIEMDMKLQQAVSKTRLAQVIQFRAKSIVEKYSSQMATADGMTLSQASNQADIEAVTSADFEQAAEGNSNMAEGITSSGAEPIIQNTESELAAAKPHTRNMTVSPFRDTAAVSRKRSKFWNEVEDFIQPADAPISAIPEAWSRQEASSTMSEQGITEKEADLLDSKSLTEPSAESSVGGSTVIDSEIMAIRYRYIVGKIAGEDLLDSNGRKIVSRGELITAEAVERADNAGKLPDLIVNMTIPGIGDA